MMRTQDTGQANLPHRCRVKLLAGPYKGVLEARKFNQASQEEQENEVPKGSTRVYGLNGGPPQEEMGKLPRQ